VGDARIIKSTGYDELDRAALTEAKRNWRLLPATRDGVAIPAWHRLRVTFKLNDG
jgi:TonB family protein